MLDLGSSLLHRYFSIIKKPIISEKATLVAGHSQQYLFAIAKDATKIEIKTAIESIYQVQVKSVQTLVRKGKRKRRNKQVGRRASEHRAYVCLVPGQEINFDVTGAK